jgi:dienelactone hydrolase
MARQVRQRSAAKNPGTFRTATEVQPMRPTPTVLVLAVVAGAILAVAPASRVQHAAAATQGPEPGTAEYAERELDNVARAHGRLLDQYPHPAFHASLAEGTLRTYPDNLTLQLEQPTRPIATLGQLVPGARTADPYRVDWAEQGRGEQVGFSYRNRYGAEVRGNLWAPHRPAVDPVTGTVVEGPLPTVVITTGSIQGYEEMYLWAAQGLAEAGYLVMTYDVQGQGQSDTFGERPDGSPWCEPQGLLVTDDPDDPCPGVPFQQRANFVEGTEDALAWLVSAENPLLALVDHDRIGLAGHSLGAAAVTEVGNRPVPVPAAPQVSIRAVVGWDDASLPAGMEPRVPTMGQAAEFFFNAWPEPNPPDPDAKLRTHERFVTAGVPSFHLTLRSSTHLEWTYVPLILPASSVGERVAMHHTLAWFDRYLKGADARGPGAREAREQRADAVRRLTEHAFDGSADHSAIGAGRWEPLLGNVPHLLEGDAVADHLSYKYRSAYAFDGRVCEDLRAGCP